jgi:hypothetical protein
MHQAKGTPSPQGSTVIVSKTQGKNEQISYHEHFTNTLDGVLTHLHHSMLDGLVFWNLQWSPRAMSEIYHCNEFQFFDLFKWQVTGDDPFC